MCGGDAPFLSVWVNAELVVSAEVVAYGEPMFADDVEIPHRPFAYRSMTVRVLDVLRGAETDSTLVVYGDPGHLCRPYITPETFPIAAKYVLALYPASALEREDSPGAYAISICGEFWLHLDDGNVRGRIRTRDLESVPYEVLRSMLRGEE